MIRVQREDFDVGAELGRLDARAGDVGGVCAFIGIVRDVASDARVTAMTLEHYPGMTERQLAGIETEARARWPLLDVLIIHRVGRLLPGDRIMLAAAASAHREAGFEACRFLVDFVKTKATFWKAEETADGRRWVAARAEDEAAAGRWQTGR